MSLRVLALTFGGPETASTYYRIVQYVDILRKGHDIDLVTHRADDFANAPDPRDFDRVVVQKKLLRGGERRAVLGAGRPVIYDLDDAIWQPHRRPHSWWTRWRTNRRLAAMARGASLCLTSNEYLSAGLRRYTARVRILPMALDESIWTPRTVAAGGAIRLGWAGAPANLPYLEALEPELERVLGEFSSARVAVVSGARPNFRRIKFDYLPYEAGREAEMVRTFDIGLLPLPRDSFAAGKSPIKALQYMASGVPTIADAVAGAEEIFAGGGARLVREPADWSTHLRALLVSPGERARVGGEARLRFVANHTRTENARKLAEFLTDPKAIGTVN